MLLSQTEWCAREEQQKKYAVFNERNKSEMMNKKYTEWKLTVGAKTKVQ